MMARLLSHQSYYQLIRDVASTALATVTHYLSHGWTRIGANCQKIGTTSYAAAVIWGMRIAPSTCLRALIGT